MTQPIEQVCVIPVQGVSQPEQVCVITSIKKKRWIFPKGIIEQGETLEQAAAKEAWEEAGVRGRLVGPELGQFHDRKWESDINIRVVVMQVHEILEDWPEADQRQRKWCSVEESVKLLQRQPLREFVKLLQRSYPFSDTASS